MDDFARHTPTLKIKATTNSDESLIQAREAEVSPTRSKTMKIKTQVRAGPDVVIIIIK
ncbi:MAG TPA: hypothetical protein VEY88_11425 [Archangium sp.]|nr:hypothetical protein [Archangium sp.]